MQTTWISMLVAASVLGCADPELSSSTVEVGGCTYLACSNSPEVLYHGIIDANLFGEPNAQGLSLRYSSASKYKRAQIYRNDVAYDLHVEKGRIYGTRPDTPKLEGQQLAGAKIFLMQGTQIVDVLRIVGVRSIPFPFGIPLVQEVYRMGWEGPPSSAAAPSGAVSSATAPPLRPACNELLWHADGKYLQRELLGMQANEVLVFEGDRIDPKYLQMSKDADPAWFNFACAGRTLAKLHLTGNTTVSRTEPDPSKAWALRQSLLKLLAADYCGKGRAFTISGQPLLWQGGVVDYLYNPTGLIEARWGPNGATCLSKPRMIDHPDVEQLFGKLEAEIAAACPDLPVCSNANPLDFDGAHFVSALMPN